MSRIMAIDFGTRRTGIAVTDNLRMIATGLDTVPTKALVPFLRDYMKKESVECIVVGKPNTLSNEESGIEVEIRSLISDLNRTFPDIKIERIDERFTSKMAQRAILDAGIKKMARRNKALVDKVSATIILQSYLEFIRP